MPEQDTVNETALRLGEKHGIQIVATDGCHYSTPRTPRP